MNPALIGTAVRGAMGAGQLIHAMLNKPGDRPKMTTPGAIKEATARNRNLANSSTDALKQGQERNVKQGMGNAMNNVKRSAGNASDVISGITEVYGRGNQAKQSVNDAYAGRKMQYDQNYNNSLQTEAQYDARNFQYNEVAPYEEAVTANNQLLQAGMGNITDAADMGSMMSAMKQGYGTPGTAKGGQMGMAEMPNTTYTKMTPKMYQNKFRQLMNNEATQALKALNSNMNFQ